MDTYRCLSNHGAQTPKTACRDTAWRTTHFIPSTPAPSIGGSPLCRRRICSRTWPHNEKIVKAGEEILSLDDKYFNFCLIEMIEPEMREPQFQHQLLCAFIFESDHSQDLIFLQYFKTITE